MVNRKNTKEQTMINKTLHRKLRVRPFNLQGGGYGFLFRSEKKFRTTRELKLFFSLSHKARNIFQEFNIRLYDKNSESDFFFPPPKSQYSFHQHWESKSKLSKL
jgi:hypothetical protein